MSIEVPTDLESATRRGPGVIRALARNPLAVVSSVVLAVFVLVAVFQPLLEPFPPDRVVLALTNAPPFTTEYILGGDKYGRDILSRLIAGTRLSLIAAVILTATALALGTVFGLISGYFGRVADAIGNGIFSVLMAVPGIVILVAQYTLLNVSLPVAMVTIGATVAPGVYFLVRSLTLGVRSELYVDAAKTSGVTNLRILGRHVLLAIKGPVVVLAAFLAGGAISISAGLDFLGLGDPTQPSWGSMLNEAFTNYFAAPWQIIWPGLALGLASAAFVLLGNAIRDTLEGAQPSATRPRRSAPTVRQHTDQAEPSDALLSIRDLRVAYRAADGTDSLVVRGVDLDVERGEVLGLVGESGSGKTQTVLSVLGLLARGGAVVDGSITFDGVDLVSRPADAARLRGRRIGYIPQEPIVNLDPSFTVGAQLVEAIRVQRRIGRRPARALALSMLARVGIADPERTMRSYPHQISGGMAQRVLIAGAVATKPDLLIADEPTTALDVTVQSEVLDLIRDLREEYGMAVLLVTHNFGVVADICDRVAVMQHGRVVERGEVQRVFDEPQHPYTRELLDAVIRTEGVR